jgi:hypothetical protein
VKWLRFAGKPTLATLKALATETEPPQVSSPAVAQIQRQRTRGTALPDDEALTWFRICERRYSLRNRSKVADTNAREQTLAAATAHFEEMFKAASTVTEFTRLLHLYYGLAKAGTAITAAHSPDPWSFSSHGLKLHDRTKPLAEMTIAPDKDDGSQKNGGSRGSPLRLAARPNPSVRRVRL